MTYEELITGLKKKDFKPIYFLYGDESYFIDRITDYITHNILTEAERSFNQTVVYGKDTDAAQVINLARRYPMMATYQVVVVKEAQDLKGFDDLVHYAGHPQPTTLLVINFKHGQPDKRKKVFKALEKAGVAFHSKKLYENQVPAWITETLSRRKLRIEPKAAAILAEFLGSDLSKIMNEIEKLVIAIGPGTHLITSIHVEEHVGISKDFNQFELQSALGRKEVLKANRIIEYFAQNQKNNHITMTISSLYFYFSKLLLLHYTKDRSRQNVASVLRINPYFVPEYEAAAKRYPASKLVEILGLLRTYDMRSKGFDGNSLPAGALLKELNFKILHL